MARKGKRKQGQVEAGSRYAVVHGNKVPMQHVGFWAAVDSSQRLRRKDSGKRLRIQGMGEVHAARGTSPEPERCRWIKREKSPIWRICALVKLSLQRGPKGLRPQSTTVLLLGCSSTGDLVEFLSIISDPLHRAVLVQCQGMPVAEGNKNKVVEKRKKKKKNKINHSKRVRKAKKNSEGRKNNGMKRSARQSRVTLGIVLGQIPLNAIRDQREAGGDPSPFHLQVRQQRKSAYWIRTWMRGWWVSE
ncbi:hypothetical protein BDW62DRAFT_154636 [Aspergillus aurantiobrunneus]